MRRCVNCEWYNFDSEVCCHSSSAYCAEFVSADGCCHLWEEIKESNNGYSNNNDERGNYARTKTIN